MERTKTIADYSLHDLPDVVLAVIEGRLKLFALIPEQRNLYFLPITAPITEAIPDRFCDENEDIEKKYLAKQGRYAIADTNPMIRKLESIYEAETHPDRFGRVRTRRVTSLNQVVSPDGVYGYLIATKRRGDIPGYEHEFVRLPFTRILAEEEKSKRQTEIDYVLHEFLKKTGNAGGAPALYRFMEDEMGAKFLPGDRVSWNDPTGKLFKSSTKRLLNRLSEMKK